MPHAFFWVQVGLSTLYTLVAQVLLRKNRTRWSHTLKTKPNQTHLVETSNGQELLKRNEKIAKNPQADSKAIKSVLLGTY